MSDDTRRCQRCGVDRSLSSFAINNCGNRRGTCNECRRGKPKTRNCAHCGNDFTPKNHDNITYCSQACGWAGRKSADRPVTEIWRRRRNLDRTQRRRAAKVLGEAKTVHSLAVFERDGWICQLCGETVDHRLAFPDPMSASLDHIKPLSLGGPHDEANVQLAHLTCNLAKGKNAAVEERRAG